LNEKKKKENRKEKEEEEMAGVWVLFNLLLPFIRI